MLKDETLNLTLTANKYIFHVEYKTINVQNARKFSAQSMTSSAPLNH